MVHAPKRLFLLGPLVATGKGVALHDLTRTSVARDRDRKDRDNEKARLRGRGKNGGWPISFSSLGYFESWNLEPPEKWLVDIKPHLNDVHQRAPKYNSRHVDRSENGGWLQGAFASTRNRGTGLGVAEVDTSQNPPNQGVPAFKGGRCFRRSSGS